MPDDINPYRPPQPIGVALSPIVGDSIIRVTRTPSWIDRLRDYRIVVDGVERGRLKAGSAVDILVAAGPHTVVAKIDWCGSPIANVSTESAAATTLDCASNLQGFRVLLAVIYVLFLRNQYLTLTQT